MPTVIRIDNLSKLYRLGEVGTGTVSHDLNRWWARIRGKDDPYALVGQKNRRDQAATSEYAWALRDISFGVEQGEVLGIIGANGAGKSTLLKLISRITSPTSGSIRAKGRIASLLEVGTGMHPEMTARENIFLNGAILGMKRHEITRKFDEIIDFAGCRMYVDTPVKRYSSGMRVRLGFAVAAFLEPEILIVDEVLAVGDAEFQKRAVGKMRQVSKEHGRTVLFVSHNMSAVRALCRSAMLLTAGSVHTYSSDVDAAVSAYLLGQCDSPISASWETRSPVGKPYFYLNAVRLVDEDGSTLSGPASSDQEIQVEISATVQELTSDLTMGYAIFGPNGDLLYYSYQVDSDRTIGSIQTTGKIVMSSRVPIEILNIGVYTIEVVGGLHCKEWLFEPGTSPARVRFELAQASYQSRTFTNRKTLLAPSLPWRIRTEDHTCQPTII